MSDSQGLSRLYLGYAQKGSGDQLDTAQEATINALVGIGYALLALAEIQESRDGGV